MASVVVGAGMAGLSAAMRLTEAGHQTTVLEARDRVGGRVLSENLSNAAVVEMGGEWIRTDQIGVSSLAATLDLRIVQTEPWLERDKAMIDTLRSLGIEKGKPFSPDEQTIRVLNGSNWSSASTALSQRCSTRPGYYRILNC
jgi:monoamine oxidase